MKKIGVALSGGGAKGFAHAGALKALEEIGIKPHIISGTSAGAVVGALYSHGLTPDDILMLFKNKDYNDFLELNIPTSGLFSTGKFISFLEKEISTKRLEDLPIPLYVTTTNLDRGISETFCSGNLHKIVMASACIPVLFTPVTIDGERYVDGGIFKNLPVSPIVDKCDLIIGINASPLITESYNNNILSIAERSYHFMFRANTIADKALCDILVEVQSVMQYGTYDLKKVEIIFEKGYNETIEIIKQNIDSFVNK